MSQRNWQSGEVTSNGLRLHYTRTGGDLPPLVLSHGFTDNGLCWTPLADALQADFDVIMPDARGHGLSEAPEDGYDQMSQVNDLAGLIHGLGLKQPILLGHSMGAATTMTLAGTYPTVPRAIILEDPPDWWTAPPQPAGFNDWIPVVKSKTREQLISEQQVATPGWSLDEIEPWADSKLQLSWNALNVLKPGNLSLDWTAVFGKITCPTLLIPADPAVGAAIGPTGIAFLRALIPHIEVAPIAGAGHSVRRDQFAAYLQVVRAFLNRIVAS